MGSVSGVWHGVCHSAEVVRGEDETGQCDAGKRDREGTREGHKRMVRLGIRASGSRPK